MLNLTRQERQVILFLLVIAFIGIGVRYFFGARCKNQNFTVLNEHLGKVNINTAEKLELMSLSGIGEKIAARIIDYRNEHKGFSDPQKLKEVKGITESRFDKLKDLIFIE